MIPAIAKVINSLFCPGWFGLSWQSRGQWSPLLVYACAVGIKLVSNLCQTSFPICLPLSHSPCCTEKEMHKPNPGLLKSRK